MSHWWAGIPPAEATVLCAGYTHTVRWEAGELIAVDHGDAEGEATLAALADETFPCLELVRTWTRRSDDPHVLTLASRGPTDLLNIDFDRLRFDHRGPRGQTEAQTLRLLAAGGQLPDRLQATTAAIWARRLRTGHATLETARPQLVAALYGRALTLRAWLHEPRLAIELTMIGPAEQRSPSAPRRASTSRCRSAGYPTSGCEDSRSPSAGCASLPTPPMGQPGPCTPSAPTSPTPPSSRSPPETMSP